MAMAFGVHHAWVASVPIPPTLGTPKLNPPFPPISASFSRRARISTLGVCSATSKNDDPSSDPSPMTWVGGSEGADHHRAQGVHNPQEVCQFLGLHLIERILEREIPSCQSRNWQVFCRLLWIMLMFLVVILDKLFQFCVHILSKDRGNYLQGLVWNCWNSVKKQLRNSVKKQLINSVKKQCSGAVFIW